MTKTLAVLLGIASLWLTAWAIAGYFMHGAGTEKLAESDHVATPAVRLERGAEIRVEGTIVEGPQAVALYSKKPCLAAVTHLSVTSHHRDIHDRDVQDSRLVATRRVGPANLEIAVGDRRIELPLDRWSPRHVSVERASALPPDLGIPAADIEAAKAQLSGSFAGFSISETTIDGGTHVFVVGKLEDRDGPLRVEADPVIGRVELYPGTQAAYLAEMRGSGGGLRVAGWILGAGVGPLPLAIVTLVWLLRRRRGAATPAA